MLKFEYIDSEKYFEDIRKHADIVCFGAGAKLHQALDILDKENIKPTVICDNNPKLWGKTVVYREEAYEIVKYDDVKNKLEDYIILLTLSSRNAGEVYQQLCSNGESHDVFQLCNPFKVDHTLLQSMDIDNRFDDYRRFYDKLEDDISKKLFLLNLQYKLTGNGLDLYELTNGNTFFDSEIIGMNTNAVYVDVGAYTGDSLCAYLQYSGGDISMYMHLMQIRETMRH